MTGGMIKPGGTEAEAGTVAYYDKSAAKTAGGNRMNIALILSGGTGVRLGTDIPKQYLEVEGKPVLTYCMETLFGQKEIDAVQIVAEPVWQADISKWMARIPGREKFSGFSLPGKNRQLSILHGLEDIRRYGAESDYVLIHDAARPLLSGEMVTECFRAGLEHEGAIPVLPMKDTVYCSTNGKTISSLLDRGTVFAGQAPEVFLLGKYYEANRRLLPDDILRINGSTEPAIMAGMDIAMIPGDEGNFKITTPQDLERFRGIILSNLKTNNKQNKTT